MKKEVLMIFKTHLDIGFTDYSENIVRKYLDIYIPNAIRVGYELKDSDTPFIWTVGSWLINRALKEDKNGAVEQAVKDGILNWHALPFTSHTELMSKELFSYALSISEKLDKRFGKTTKASKMTDVPGHTAAMIPHLCSRGIKFLHIGVNPATPLPPVPDLFKWKRGENEIVVMYQGDYGEDADFGDFVLCFAHTGDNLGPQSSDEIRKIYKAVQEKYPDCVVKASTLDEVAERIGNIKNIPVIDKEIGDTWIHGAGTDPLKISRFKNVLRHIKEKGITADISDSLLLVPEHTWGMDIKRAFHDDRNYTHDAMEKLIDKRATIEKSWLEQRNYVFEAEKLLGIKPDYDTRMYDLSEWEETDIPEDIGFELSWQIFDNSDYDRYERTYMRCHLDWAMWDFVKVGLPEYAGGIYKAHIEESYKKAEEMLYKLSFDKDIAEKYGLPYFYAKVCKGNVEIKWFDKKASRLPQACWLKFKGCDENWEICKMDEWFDVNDVIGSPLICAAEKVKNGKVVIEPLDSALVAPFGKRLLQYNVSEPMQDMNFCLYNNIWNTNFPLWYSDDAVFRYILKEVKS